MNQDFSMYGNDEEDSTAPQAISSITPLKSQVEVQRLGKVNVVTINGQTVQVVDPGYVQSLALELKTVHVNHHEVQNKLNRAMSLIAQLSAKVEQLERNLERITGER